jgi:lipopolysaccharide biosynthesis glycosyltransferase
MVSMYSLLTNCNKNKTFIIYHISCTPDFNETSIKIFKSLVKKFSHNVEIIIYNMGNHFNNRKNKRYSQAAYYRILTPIFIDSDRAIHLDGDTLVFSDLNEMYNLDFNDNYILGIYDYLSNGVDYLGLKSKIFINTGAILLNLKKLREDNKVFELLNLTKSNTYLRQVDQTAFNYLLYPKIGRLPSKYVIFNFEDKSDIIFYINHLRTKIPIEEIEKAFKNPIIIHNVICYPKIWDINSVYQTWLSNCAQRHNCSCKKYFDIWHFFAKKTDYYEEISKFTGVKKLI